MRKGIFDPRPSTPKVRFMLEIEIQDGFLDCPKSGLIGELRCLPSCKHFASKDDDRVQCKSDEDTETE